FEATRIEEVRDHDGQAGLARAARVIAETLVQVGGPARLDLAQEVRQMRELVAPTHGRPALAHAVAQDSEAHALAVDEPHEPQGGGQPRRVLELLRLTEPHRAGGIDEQVQAEILLVDEELDVQPIEPAEDIPVDVAEVVTDAVRPVIGELDTLSLARAAPLAFHSSPERPARRQRQPLQLGQKVWRERDGPDSRRHGLALVERLEIVSDLSVEVPRHLLARQRVLHLLPVLTDDAEVAEPRGHLAATARHVRVVPVLAGLTRFTLDPDLVRICTPPLRALTL